MNILPELSDGLNVLLDQLVKSSFVIEKQPPQVIIIGFASTTYSLAILLLSNGECSLFFCDSNFKKISFCDCKTYSKYKSLEDFTFVISQPCAECAGSEDEHPVQRDHPAAGGHQAQRAHVAARRHRLHHLGVPGQQPAAGRTHQEDQLRSVE